MNFLVINGPNLNMLGVREPSVYGDLSLEEINKKIKNYARLLEVDIDFYHSNSEGELINQLQKAEADFQAVIFNPGAYSHYSYALRDAVSSIGIPVIEVHLSNIHAREDFRKNCVIAPACLGQISGFGYIGYILAIEAAKAYLEEADNINGQEA